MKVQITELSTNMTETSQRKQDHVQNQHRVIYSTQLIQNKRDNYDVYAFEL